MRRTFRWEIGPWGVRSSATIILASLVAVGVWGCGHKSVEDYIQAGDQARQNSQLAQAESDYQAAIKTAPDDARPHIALGNLYIFEKKTDAARSEFAKALDLSPHDAGPHAAIGRAYVDQSMLPSAENQYRAAVVLDPANVGYRLALADVLQKANKQAAAETELRTAIGLDPKNARAHLALANLLNGETNRQNEAQAEYAEVKSLDSSLLPASAETVPSGAAASVAGKPAPKIKDIDKRFLLTHDSPVYDSASSDGHVLAQVHRKKFVHVTGIAGDWLRIQLKNGIIGYIPVTAAE